LSPVINQYIFLIKTSRKKMKHPLSTKRVARIILFSAAVCSIFFYACKKKDKDSDTTPEHIVMRTSTSALQAVYTDTVVTGTAVFTQPDAGGDVTMTMDITVPSRANKSVAVHFHAMNDCGSKGANAMGHWNPTGVKHGKFGTVPFHSGDIGNIPLDSKGHATYTVITNLWSLGGSDTTTNIVNRSIIIHSGVDDYTTQPSGNSGNRIGCTGINSPVIQ
jgi:Cu-Zn family superoxide dismutase